MLLELNLNLLLAYLENSLEKRATRRGIRMSALPVNDDLNAAAHSTNMRAEIQRKWRRFNAQEVEALIDNQDLVCKLSKKYRLDHFQAKQIVKDFTRGRQL